MWLHPELGVGVALCPLPGTRAWQFQGAAELDADGNPTEPSLETLQRVFDRHAGMRGVRLHNATWLSTYRVNVRMAQRFRRGHIFLAGDAAHVHSIAGGLGMNTGIQDAYNLGWKLGLVLAGGANPGLLDTYEEERLPIAAWTLNLSSERQRVVIAASRAGQAGIDAAGTRDTTQLGIGYRGSSLASDLAPAAGTLRAGDRAPDAPCRDGATHQQVRLFDVFRGPHFTLLGFGVGCAAAIRAAEATHAGYLHARLIVAASETPPAGPDTASSAILVDGEGHARRAYDISTNTLVLLRPDGYVGLTSPPDIAAVSGYFDALGRP